MKKPVVCITPDVIVKEYDLGVTKFVSKSTSTGYSNYHYITEYGGIPMVPALVESDEEAMEIMERCDGLFVTGGDDVDPALYGEEVQPYCGGLNPIRDKSDMCLIKAAVELKKPILSFCRGSQIVNVFYGGTLYQDIKTQTGTDIIHPAFVQSIVNKDTEEQVHDAKVLEGTPLSALIGKTDIRINSTHHQAVKDLAPALKLQAVAPDGITESRYLDSDDHYVRTYQWHPELQGKNPVKDAIAEDFIAACIKKMNK